MRKVFVLLDKVFEPLLIIKDPIERIQKFGEEYMSFGLANPEYYDLMFLKNEPVDALRKEGHEKWKSGDHAFTYLVLATEEILTLHPHMKMEPLVVAFSLWSMVHGFVSLQLTDRLCWYSNNFPSKDQAGFMALSWLTSLLRNAEFKMS